MFFLPYELFRQGITEYLLLIELTRLRPTLRVKKESFLALLVLRPYMLFACFLHLSLDERIPKIRSLPYINIFSYKRWGCTPKNPLSIALDRLKG
jgi:hypothetical protein